MLRHNVVTCRYVSGSVVCLGIRMVDKSIGLEDPYMPFRVSSGHVVECRRRDSLPAIVSMECR